MMNKNEMFVCANDGKCKWKGLESQTVQVPKPDSTIPSFQLTCPRCGGIGFYIKKITDAKRKQLEARGRKAKAVDA